MRSRWEEHYPAYLRDTVTEAGLLFIFDNYALLEFSKLPDGGALTTTINTITVLAWPIPSEKAYLSTDPERLPAMKRVDDPALYSRIRKFFSENKTRLVPTGRDFRLDFSALGPFDRTMFPCLDDGPARLSDFVVLPSIEAKSSSVRDTAFKTLAKLIAIRAGLRCSKVGFFRIYVS